jgi:hypothetical protein
VCATPRCCGDEKWRSDRLAEDLIDPKDAVTIAVQFAKLPAGINHVATAQINGVSKQMAVAIQIFNYQLSQM